MSLSIILRLFLSLGNSEPRYSYNLYSYKKLSVFKMHCTWEKGDIYEVNQPKNSDKGE